MALSSAFWTTLSGLTQQAVQLGVTIILARLLLPRDFGLVAMLLVFTNFAGLFVDFGLAAALIQRRDIEERHRSSVFWLNLGIGVGMAVLMAILAPAIALFYGQPRLLPIAIVLGFDFILASTSVVQTALLQRDLRFRRLAAADNLAIFVSGGLAVAAAATGFGVWSLVIQALAFSGMRAIVLFTVSGWQPRLLWDRAAIRDVWRFGSNLAGFNIVNYWSRNGDNLLIGKAVGSRALGLYNQAYILMLAPQTQVTSLVCVAMYPVLARVKDERERLKRAYLRIVHVIACITFPLLCGLFAVAYPFIDVLLGQKWRGAAPILQILCVAALIQSVTSTTGLIYQTQGRTDWAFRWGGTAAALTLVAFGVGIFWGVEGVAAAYSVRTILLLPVNYEIAGRLIGLRFREVARAIWSPLLASIVMAVFVWVLGMVLPHEWSPLLRLITQIVAGAALYLPLALIALDGGTEVRDLLRDRRLARVANEVVA